MKILLIEDSRPIAAAVKRQLKPNFAVEAVSLGEAGLTKALSAIKRSENF